MSRNLRLGIFVAIAILVLGVSVFLIGGEQSRFTRHYRVLAYFDNVQGLVEGSEVRVGGVQKGAVRRIALPSGPSGRVIVELDMERETDSVVKQDSVASIRSNGLLGDQFVEVSFGSEGAGEIQDGATLQSREPSDMSAVVGKVETVLDRATGALGNIEQITGKVNDGHGTLGSLLNDRSMYHEAKAGVTALKEDAQALKSNFFLRGFFKERGYKDVSDLAANEIKEVPSKTPAERYAYPSKDIFDDSDNAKLKNEKKFEAAGKKLEEAGFKQVVIVASTGPTGDTDKSLDLARARAYVVRKYLVEKFKVDDTKIKTIGLGKDLRGVDEVSVLIFR